MLDTWKEWELEALSTVAQKEITLLDDVHRLSKRLRRSSQEIRSELYRLRSTKEWEKWTTEKKRSNRILVK